MAIDETTGNTTGTATPAEPRTRPTAHALRSKRLPIAAMLVAAGSAIAVVVRRRQASKTARNRWRPAFLHR